MVRKRKRKIINILKTMLIVTAAFSMCFSAVAEDGSLVSAEDSNVIPEDSLKPTVNNNPVDFADESYGQESSLEKLLNVSDDNNEYRLEISCKAQMTVPDAGIDYPMEVEFEECLSGWFYDSENYAFDGIKSVGLNNESTSVDEYYYGAGEICYTAEAGDWYEDETSSKAEFIVRAAESGNLIDSDCSLLLGWIFPDYAGSFRVNGDMFQMEKLENQGRTEIVFSLKGESAADLQLQKEYDRYIVSELTVKIFYSESSEKQTELSDAEKEILKNGLYDTDIRNGYRNFNSGRDECYLSVDGNPFFPSYYEDVYVSIEKWDGCEHTGGYESVYSAFVSYEDTVFEISQDSMTVEYYLEDTESWQSQYGYVITKGSLDADGVVYPYLLVSEPNIENVPETIYSAFDVDDRFIIKIEISHDAGSADNCWTLEEAEQLLEMFAAKIHFTPGIKTLDQVEK